jgi:hypothetical protein
MTVKRLFGFAAKIIVSVVVLAFLGLHSLNFFQFTFPPEQWYYSYLGFGLTSGGVILYLVMFMTESDTVLKRFIAITMLAVSLIGELATAGFGMQIESWRTAGYALTESDFQFMIIGVQILSLCHGMAMVAYFAGDKIVTAFADDDKDGIPNAFDKDYRPKSAPKFVPNAADTELVKLREENARLKAEAGPKASAGNDQKPPHPSN